VARLVEICDLAERHGAIVMIDDAHAHGHLGEAGRGTPALTGAGDRVGIVTGTLGKTLGGGMGGFVAGPQLVVDILRQRSRPYLFSNSLAPPVAAGALKAIDIAEVADDLRAHLMKLVRRFRAGMESAGFALLPGGTPIVPVMLNDARLAQQMARELDERGVYVAGFFFPVVPSADGARHRFRARRICGCGPRARHRLGGIDPDIHAGVGESRPAARAPAAR
jgi:glycine C-acetyltransferase